MMMVQDILQHSWPELYSLSAVAGLNAFLGGYHVVGRSQQVCDCCVWQRCIQFWQVRTYFGRQPSFPVVLLVV